MGVMLKQRGGILFAMNDNYCIDNGAMIAYTGSLYYKVGKILSVENSSCLQRFIF